MWLRVLTGTRTGKLVEIRGTSFVVGRDRSCDLVLRDRGVARRHAAFHRDRAGRLLIEDLGSPEGTFVATRRITRPVEVQGNEEVSFGPVAVRVLLAGPRAAERRPGVVIGVAAGVLAAIVGAVAGVLATQVGGGGRTEHAAPAPGRTHVAVQPSADINPVTTRPGMGAEPGPGPTGSARGDARHVVLRDDFASPDSGWEVFANAEASARYADGGLVLDIANPSYFGTSVSGHSFRSPVVSVTVDNAQGSSFAAFGVVCRYRSEDDFYLLAAGTDGTAAILRRFGGRLRVLTGSWVRTSAVPTAAPRYHVRAECLEQELRLVIDGRTVLSLRRPGAPGDVGVFAAGKVAFRFDDVRVTDIGSQ